MRFLSRLIGVAPLYVGLVCAFVAAQEARSQELLRLGDPKVAAEAFQRYGPVDLNLDTPDWPLLAITLEGRLFYVEFYGCNSPLTKPECSVLGINTILPMRPGYSASMARVSEFNFSSPFLQMAIAQNGDVLIRHDFIVAGGVTEAYLDVIVDGWLAFFDDAVRLALTADP